MSILFELMSENHTMVGRGRYYKSVEHDSLVYNADLDLFFWNSKQINGNAYTWLTRIKGYSRERAKSFLKQCKNKDSEIVTSNIFKTTDGETITVSPELVNLFWEAGKKHRGYWYTRGFTDATCDRFKLGYHQGWHTIPFYVDNQFVNFQLRRDIPDKKIRPWYRGIGPTLFNGDILNVASSVVIAESPTDAIILNQYGYPAVSHNAGASYWDTSWNSKFTNQKEIYIVYDNDEPGIKGAKQIAEALGKYRCFVYNFEDYPDKYDTGDWFLEHSDSPELFGELLENNARMVFE